MSISSAGAPSRWLRLGLSAGAASMGAVALSLLAGGSAASASEDQDPGRLGAVVQLSSAVGGVVETVTDPLDATLGGLGTALAPLEQSVQPATAPIVDRIAPIAQPVLQAPPIALETVRDVVAPTTEVLAPVLQPLTPVTEPVLAPVDRLVDSVLHDGVAPVATPVAETVDVALGVLPIVDGLLGEAPVAGLIDPVIGIDPVDLIRPVPAEPGIVPSLGLPPALDGEPDAPLTVGVAPALDGASTSFDASVVAPSTGARGAEPGAARAEVVSTAAGVVVAVDPRGGGRDLVPAAPPLDGIVPSGASGGAGTHASPPAIVQDFLLPALAAGRVDALEHDRVPSSLAEEHTASPD